MDGPSAGGRIGRGSCRLGLRPHPQAKPAPTSCLLISMETPGGCLTRPSLPQPLLCLLEYPSMVQVSPLLLPPPQWWVQAGRNICQVLPCQLEACRLPAWAATETSLLFPLSFPRTPFSPPCTWALQECGVLYHHPQGFGNLPLV